MPVVYQANAIVHTPYGLGKVTRTGSRTVAGEAVVPATLELIDWTLASKTHPKLTTHDSSWNVVPTPIFVGCDAMCPPLGRCRIEAIDEEKDVVKVRASDWKLAGNSRVYMYLPKGQCTFVERKKFGELSPVEKIEKANELREEAKVSVFPCVCV